MLSGLSLDGFGEVSTHVIRDMKRGLRPVKPSAGQRHFVGAKGRTMTLRRIDLIRATVPNVSPTDDNCRPGILSNGSRERGTDGIGVMSIGTKHSPTKALKATLDILREGDIDRAVDGDLIVVIEPDQIVETPVSSHRCRLVTDAFHQVTI